MKHFTFRRNTTPTIGATTLKKQKNLIKTMLLAVVLLVGSGMAWGQKITDVANIVSGQSYYIGATTGISFR